MKTSKIAMLAAIAIALVTLWGCDKEATYPTAGSVHDQAVADKSGEPFPSAGALHNEFLSEFDRQYPFERGPSLSYDDFIDTASDIAVNVVAEHGVVLSKKNAERAVTAAFANCLRLKEENILVKGQPIDFIGLRSVLVEAAVLNPSEVDILVDIFEDLNSKGLCTPAAVKEAIDARLESEVAPAKDSHLGMALDVLYSSSVYWQNELGPGFGVKRPDFPWGDLYILVSDGVGGVLGSMVGLIGGAFGIVIGGTIGYTVCSAIAMVQVWVGFPPIIII